MSNNKRRQKGRVMVRLEVKEEDGGSILYRVNWTPYDKVEETLKDIISKLD